MSSKPIIVDGVDVSKCYRYSKKTGYCEGAFKPEELPFCENFDCDYKCYKRAVQKLESIKERLTRVSYLDPQSTRLLKLDIEDIIGGKVDE